MTGRARKGKEYLMAIDQGTTGTTVLIVDAAGRMCGRGYREFPQYFPRPGWVEHDGEEIWQSVVGAVREANRDALRNVSSKSGSRSILPIAAVGITNQRETVLLWDRKSGKAVHRAIVWQDRRTADLCVGFKKAKKEELVRKRTGLLLDPYFSATKLTWLFKNQPQLARRARRGELAFGTVDSWILWKLTAGTEHATDFTNASRTLLFDIGKRRWDPELLRLFRVPEAILPEVRQSSGWFGATRGVPGLADGTPILGMAGDQQAALYGQGCVRAGQVKNTYGTGAFLLMNTGKKRVRSRHGLLTTLACDAAGAPVYALEGSVFVAGAAIQWLRDELGILDDACESEAIARSVPDTAGTVLVPAFVGLGAPYWNPQARGAWMGLTRGAGRAHLVRATLESIAFQCRDVFDAMIRDAGRKPRGLRVDGGAAANNFLMQFQADILGIQIERPQHLETTALGALGLAARAAGIWPDGRPPGGIGKIERKFRPRLARAERERRVADWRLAVQRLLS